MKNLKIAIVHDYIKEYGGAESVLENLSDIFPDAPIFTTLYQPEFLGPHRSRLEKKWDHRIKQSFFQYIPFAYKIISPLRLLSPLAFKLFDFSSYDIVLTSATGAYFPNSLNKNKAKLICYCHTPPRYLYGLPTARNLTNNALIRALVSFINHFLRLLDFKYSRNVDLYLANSSTTSMRIKKFYRRDSVVINPPVDLPVSTTYQKVKGNYFLTGGRLARAKRYDVAIQACNQLGVSLKIFGRDFAGFMEELKKNSGPKTEFLGEVDQATKSNLYQNAKAFIFCSDNEDFGIVPVESMAYGCPVIAYKSGGVVETVIDKKTGIFFDKLDSQSCAEAIKQFNKLKLNTSDCITQAQKFSTEKFKDKIKQIIKI